MCQFEAGFAATSWAAGLRYSVDRVLFVVGMPLRAMRSRPLMTAALLDHVEGVIGWLPQPKMIDVPARARIAGVADEILRAQVGLL